MEEYAVYLHSELLQSVPKQGKQHDLILGFVRLLAQYPDTSGDFVDKDDTLRTRQIKIIGDYAITYWVDHAVKAVIIVSVRAADR